MRRLSPSALERYRACPRQFLHVDVERVPRGEPGPTLAIANAVHGTLELFFGVDVERRTPELLERALRSVWPKHRTRDTFASREEEAAAGRQALDLLARFARSFDLSPNGPWRGRRYSVKMTLACP
jgi:hypothetical protein